VEAAKTLASYVSDTFETENPCQDAIELLSDSSGRHEQSMLCTSVSSRSTSMCPNDSTSIGRWYTHTPDVSGSTWM
jgi:hypothetical protein